MPTREIDPKNIGANADWEGNNAAFTCPVCTKIFLVSGLIHKAGRSCPACGMSKGYVTGGKATGGAARIEWTWADDA